MGLDFARLAVGLGPLGPHQSSSTCSTNRQPRVALLNRPGGRIPQQTNRQTLKEKGLVNSILTWDLL